jgi:hypothetical protein
MCGGMIGGGGGFCCQGFDCDGYKSMILIYREDICGDGKGVLIYM